GHRLPHGEGQGDSVRREQHGVAPPEQSDRPGRRTAAGGAGGALMRKTSLDMVYEIARKDPRVFFIGSDLGVGTLDAFRNEMPDRFFMEGVSEANIVSMAAGLALEGKIVYVNTIATFLTRRCYEQVVLDLGLHNTNVRLIANGGGV